MRAKKRDFEGQVAWITGGGSGLGKALALELAARGAEVAVSGRRVERLEAVAAEIRAAGGEAFLTPCDVTDEASIEIALADVVDHFGRVDVVVANAGFGVTGKIRRLSAEDWRRQLDTNVVGLAMTAKHALPKLEKTNGRLALVGSVAGFVIAPGFAPYHASKYAVRAIGQALAIECHGSGVSVTTLHPGFVESEIGQVDNDGVHHPDRADPRPRRLFWKAPRAARVMADAIARRKREVVFTGHGRFVAFLGKHFPGLVHFGFTRSAARKRRRPRKPAVS